MSVGFCVPSIMQGAHGRGVLVGDGTAQPPDRPRVSACSVVVIATVLCTRDDGTQSSRMLAFCCFFDAISAHCDARRYNNCSHPVRHGKRAIYLADSQMDWKDGPITGGGLEPGPTGDSAALFYELICGAPDTAEVREMHVFAFAFFCVSPTTVCLSESTHWW